MSHPDNLKEIEKYKKKLLKEFKEVSKDYHDGRVDFDCVEEIIEEAIDNYGGEYIEALHQVDKEVEALKEEKIWGFGSENEGIIELFHKWLNKHLTHKQAIKEHEK